MQAPRRLQLRRGNTAAVSTYLGAQGELIINTDTNTLYIHDGVTVGGFATTVNVAVITNSIVSANVGMKGYVDAVIAANVANIAAGYTNTNVKSYLGQFDGNIIPSANAVYSLGSVTNQWKSLFVSNNTIYVGGVPLSIDNSGNLTINGNTIPTISYVNTVVANVTVDLSSYALNANVTAANVGLKGYVDLANTIQSAQLTSANLGVIGYIDLANTIQSAQVGAANLAITAANLGMRGYVDNQITTITGGAPAILDTLGELANALGADANLSVTITSQIANVNANTTTANLGMRGYVDSQSFYSNVKVATYLPTYDGNIAANISKAGYTWTFGSDAVLTLPSGGTILESGYGSAGAIRLKPNGGTSTQYLEIAPTAVDGNHIHLMAGSGTELFLGDDNQYVKLANTGGVVINSNDSAGNTAQWTFGKTGTTQFPNSLILAPVSQSITMQSDQYSQLMWENANVTVAPNMAINSNFYVAQNSATLDIGYRDGNSTQLIKSWLWSVDGNLTLPSGGYILNSDNSIYGGGSYSNVEVATYLQSGNIANISVAGNVTATYFVGNGALLTGIVGGASNYGNVDVRNFLKTGDGASRLIQGYYANIDLGATAQLFSFGATAKSYFGHDGQLGNASINWVRADNGDVRISTNNAAYNWIFDRTGNLTLPYGAIIRDSSINTLAIGTDAGNVTNTQNGAIAIGYLAGSDAQNYDAVAIGSSAGGGGSGYYSPQGQEAVAVGSGAGMQSQGIYTVAVGSSAGGNLQSTWGVAVGHLAGETIQGIGAVAFGASAGYIGQGAYAVAIGNKAGVTNQGNNSIIINATGNVLNQTTANTFTVAPIRTDSGNTAQALYYNALTKEITYANVTAGGSNYGNVNVAAYLNTQGYNLYSNVNVANYLTTATITTTGNVTAANFVGNISITGNVTGTSANVTLQAGAYTSVFDNQGNVTVPQLFTAGNIQTAGYLFGNAAFLTGIAASSNYSNVQVATYLPTYTGNVANLTVTNTLTLTATKIALGSGAGAFGGQGTDSIAIGRSTGQNIQGNSAVAVGGYAGQNNQGDDATAIGQNAGFNTQSLQAVAVGSGAGQTFQSMGGVAVGYASGQTSQGLRAVAIGSIAGNDHQGQQAIAIGHQAGYSYQPANSIEINASGTPLNYANLTAGLYIDPVRNDLANVANIVYFNAITKELTYAPTPSSSNYSNVNVKAYTETMGFANYSNVNVAAYLSTFSGNIANIRLGPSGVITFADGTTQTTASAGGGSSYSNVNVAAYLPTYGGTIQSSNVQTTTANIQATTAATNPATGALRVMGGVGVAGAVVAAQLNSTGNLIANAVSAYSLNTVANVTASVVNAGTINSAGNVLAQNIIGTIATASQTNITAVGTLATLSVSGNATVGNLVGTEANTRIIANVYTTTFDIYGNVSFPGNIITPTGLYVGPTLFTALPNTIAQFTANANAYAQINFENLSSGTDATADYIATANNGTDTTFFVDLGITNNNYDNASPTNSLGTAVFANDSYLYAQGNLATTTGGNLVIGTSTANKSVKIFAGGINSGNIVATVSNTGVAVTGNVSATGNITATGYIVTAGGFGNISQVDTITANTVNSTGNIRVNGNIAVNGPAFGAYANTAVQTITSGSQQKVQFQVEEYDTNSSFADSRFTPTAAGIYQFNAEVRFDGSYGTGESMIVLYKNGAEHKRGWNASGVNWASSLGAMTVSTQAMANGTGDYFEIYVQQTSGGNLTITAVNNPAITWFNGCMLRGL